MSKVVHDIGTPPQESNCWSYNEFRFHNFADLSSRGYRSPNFECLGHRWIVVLWPNGFLSSVTSVYLWCKGNDDRDAPDNDANVEDTDPELINSLDIDFGFTVRDCNGNGKEVVNKVSKFNPTPPDDDDGHH